MNQVTYQVGYPEVFSPSSSFALSVTPPPPKNDGATITSYKKLLCMTLSKATEIRVLSISGGKCDTTLKFPIRSLISTENFRSNSMLFYGVGDQDLVILETSVQASGNINLSSKYVPIKEELVSVASAGNNTVVALGKNNICLVDENSGSVVERIPHLGKVSAGSEIAYYEQAKLLAFPFKNTLTIFSLALKKSVLSKAWEPHTSPTTFVKFFRLRKFSMKTNEDELLIFTATRNNSELRFWTFNTSTNRSTLKEEVSIEAGDEENGKNTLDFDISVTSCEEYITLCSKTSNIAIIVELDRTQFKAGKITTWRIPNPALCSCARLTKVCMEKYDVRMELFLAVRTNEGFHQLLIDEAKIASETSSTPMESLANWTSSDAANPVPSLASYPQQRLLSVSSSVQGDSKAFTIAAETNAAAVVHDQTLFVTNELQKIKKGLSDTNGFIVQLMRILHSQNFEKMADRLGKEFAERNKGRLVVKAPPPPLKPSEEADMTIGGKTKGQKDIMDIVLQFKNAIYETVEENTTNILKKHFHYVLQSALKEVTESLHAYDATGSSQLYVSDSSLVKDAQLHINQVCAEAKASFKALNTEDVSNSSIIASTTELNAMADQFLSKLRATVIKVKGEIKETKEILAKIDVPQDAPVDSGAILSRCISLGESGDWAGALRAALHASNTSLLLNFLESQPCQENMSILSQPTSIDIADFLSLCLQLSFEIETVPGAIPSRLDYLHRFLAKWDDHLQETKKRAPHDERCAGMLKLISTEFTHVFLSLEPIELKSLPRSSRTHCQLTRKIIANFIN